MKYYFRGHIVFEYDPTDKYDKVKMHNFEDGDTPAFKMCQFINEDYRLLGEFFTRVYKHTQGEDVDLTDIEVY